MALQLLPTSASVMMAGLEGLVTNLIAYTHVGMVTAKTGMSVNVNLGGTARV
jgi:hypothetical protein